MASTLLRSKSKLIFCGFILLSSLAFAIDGQNAWAPGEVIVKFKDDLVVNLVQEDGIIKTGLPSIDAINTRYQLKEMERLFPIMAERKAASVKTPSGRVIEVPNLVNIYHLKFDPTSNMQEIISAYRNDPHVLYAEPNYYARMCRTPNDPRFSEQWGFRKIEAPRAWDIQVGDTSAVIGILDTGIDTSHIDLAGNIWINRDEIPNNGIDDDGNGYIDDVKGWNFVNRNNIVQDGAGHGSHCAGIVSAVTDNAIGVAGTSWRSKLMAVKVLNNNGVGLYSDIVLGINYASNNGAKIINMSLGGYASSQLLRDAVINAYVTSVPVGAAGNDARSDSFFPGSYEVALGVAATDSFDKKWDGSNLGKWVDVSAPGVGVLSTKIGDYGYFTGTSMSAPYVSGVAALVASGRPWLSPGSIINAIINNTDPIDSLNPNHQGMLGSGRLNAYKTITWDSLPLLTFYKDSIDDFRGDRDGIADAGETVNVFLTLNNIGSNATGVSAILHTDDVNIRVMDSLTQFGNILAREKRANTTDLLTFALSDTCPQHNVLFKLYVTANGGRYQDTIDFSIATQNTRNVSGVISTNTTWRRGTYVVTGNVLVNPGVTLTIEPGVAVLINPGLYIRVDGILNAIGTQNDSIRITRNGTTGTWDRLLFNPGSKATFKYCRIERANAAINGTADSLYVGYCTISNNSGGGIECHGIMTVTYSTICDNSSFGLGVWCHGSSEITYNSICNNAGSGIRCSGTVKISNNIIAGNVACDYGGGGIHIMSHGLRDTMIIRNNLIFDNHATAMGGAIYDAHADSVLVQIQNNAILANSADSSGGGLCIICSSRRIVTGNNINSNMASIGGGIYMLPYGESPKSATISRNTISSNRARQGGGIYVDERDASPVITCNTIIDTNASSIYIRAGRPVMHQNNLIAKRYAVYNNTVNNIAADTNWWGMVDTLRINQMIYDYYDDFTLGIVNYRPFLTTPSQAAPPYLDSLRVVPDVVGVETLRVYLTFSKPMKTSVPPRATFGIAPNDTQYTFSGSWSDTKHWNGLYYINEMIRDSTYRIRVADAKDDSDFVIPVNNSYTFRVYTAGSQSRELFATPIMNYISLRWHPSRIINLLGYKMYRDTVSGGPYQQINTAIITDTTYNDYNVSGGIRYFYVYTIVDNNFIESSYSSEASAQVGIKEDEIKELLPTVFMLYPNHPNPFFRKTTIKFAVPRRAQVSLKIYDVQGRLVKTLIDGMQEPGYHAIDWKGSDQCGRSVASGVYFIQFEAKGYAAIQKAILQR